MLIYLKNRILVPLHKIEIPISQTQSDNAEITQWNINKKNNEQASSNQKQNKEKKNPIALGTAREADTDTTRQKHNTLEDQEPDTNSKQIPNQSINLGSQTVLIPVLSIYMVLCLISDSIDKMCPVNTTAIERVDYYLKRNYISTGSCIKMQEIKLRKRNIFDVMPSFVIKSA